LHPRSRCAASRWQVSSGQQQQQQQQQQQEQPPPIDAINAEAPAAIAARAVVTAQRLVLDIVAGIAPPAATVAAQVAAPISAPAAEMLPSAARAPILATLAPAPAPSVECVLAPAPPAPASSDRESAMRARLMYL